MATTSPSLMGIPRDGQEAIAAKEEAAIIVRGGKDVVAFSLLHGRRFALIAFMVLAL